MKWNSFIATMVLSAASSAAFAQVPSCPNVHVWYALNNASSTIWFVQVARLYENNISFVDESCTELDLNQKIELMASSTRYVGMKIDKETGFNATYSFMGVRGRNPSPGKFGIPKGTAACAFIVAPYGPGQMDRVDWKTNNADCYATQYGTSLYFQ